MKNDTELFIKETVLNSIKNNNHTLEDISIQTKGIYLSELKLILNKLVIEKKIKIVNNKYYLKTEPVFNLPYPHPLDYEWRFDKLTLTKLSDELINRTLPGNNLLLIGAHTLFIELSKKTSDRKVILIDRNSELVNILNKKKFNHNFYIINLDLFEDLETIKEELKKIINIESFDFIFFDPPWYPLYYDFFLDRTTQLVKIGGYISMSLFPINTRPYSFKERADIFNKIYEYGLDICTLYNDYISYETPIFERFSLKNDDINIYSNWRKSDFLILNKVTKSNLTHPKKYYDKLREDIGWLTFLIDNKKIKIKGDFTDYNIKPSFITIEKNNILKTVSKRYHVRSKVDLWFWDNRVFALTGKVYFLNVLYILSNKEIPNEIRVTNQDYLDIAISLLEKELKKDPI
jgi:hypothetical protein